MFRSTTTTMFMIKLAAYDYTGLRHSGQIKETWINPAYITALELRLDDRGEEFTCITLAGENRIFVKETPEEIFELARGE